MLLFQCFWVRSDMLWFIFSESFQQWTDNFQAHLIPRLSSWCSLHVSMRAVPAWWRRACAVVATSRMSARECWAKWQLRRARTHIIIQRCCAIPDTTHCRSADTGLTKPDCKRSTQESGTKLWMKEYRECRADSSWITRISWGNFMFGCFLLKLTQVLLFFFFFFFICV